MNSDSHFLIGATHQVCQDYATHGKIGDVHYVIGADGCSSSQKTDLGARLLCELARKVLEVHGGWISLAQMKRSMIQEMRQLKSQLNIDGSNFDATLVVALADKRDMMIYCWGDGVIKVTLREDTLISKIEFESNAPRYLSYGLDSKRHADYLEFNLGKNVVVTEFHHAGEKNSTNFGVDGYEFGWAATHNDALKEISIMSDGVNTYSAEHNQQPIDVVKAVADITDFRTTKGRFVERQMNWLQKQQTKEGIVHADDVFCATIIA